MRRKNLPDVVPAAARAGRRHLPADKAAARRQPQLLAGDFRRPLCHHVDVQKPPEGKALLDLHHPSFSGDKIEVDQQVQLVPRPLVALDALSNFRPLKAQLGQDAALALLESFCKSRRALDRPGNIEGQADQRPLTLFQQLPLGVGRLSRADKISSSASGGVSKISCKCSSIIRCPFPVLIFRRFAAPARSAESAGCWTAPSARWRQNPPPSGTRAPWKR